MCPDWFWGPSSLQFNGQHKYFPWRYSDRGMTLTTHFHLAQRLRTHAAVPVPPHILSRHEEGQITFPQYSMEEQFPPFLKKKKIKGPPLTKCCVPALQCIFHMKMEHSFTKQLVFSLQSTLQGHFCKQIQPCLSKIKNK